MLTGNDKNVAGIDRLNVHESGNGFIPVDEAGLFPAFEYRTENAVIHSLYLKGSHRTTNPS